MDPTNLLQFLTSQADSITSAEDKKTDDQGGRLGRARGQSNAAWLPSNTPQKEWRPVPREMSVNGRVTVS